MSRRYSYARLLTALAAALGWAGCVRTDVAGRLDVVVVERVTSTTIEGLPVELRVPMPGAAVALRPAGGAGDAFAPVWNQAATDDEGRAGFAGVEGLYDVLVDVDGDAVADLIEPRVASGSTAVVVYERPAAPATDATKKGSTKPPTAETDPVVAAAPLPVLDGMWLNGGAASTNSYFVEVTVAAENAAEIALTETPPAYGLRARFAAKTAYRFSAGQGPKTLWAIVYNADGEFAGPVSATITVYEHPPYPPVAALLRVTTNPPGSPDFLAGLPGAVYPGNTVKVYADHNHARLLGTALAGADGAFGPLDIHDGSDSNFANVEKPFDLVYVTSTDVFGQESADVWIENDSTPPWDWKLSAAWENKYPPASIGNRGEAFRVTLTAAADVAGARIYLPPFGGASYMDAPANPSPSYTASMTIPVDRYLDAAGPVTAMVWDAAFNSIGDCERIGRDCVVHELNAAPPAPPTTVTLEGGNRRLLIKWNDVNLDTETYAFHLTLATGESAFIDMPASNNLCAGSGGAKLCQQNVPDLINCRDYWVTVNLIDRGLNETGFSAPVSTLVILPPPDISAWGGVADPSNGYGSLYFTMTPVENASGYQLHFADRAGAPYDYTAPGGAASPVSYTSLPRGYGSPEVGGLPYGARFYLAATALDGACSSAYSAEVSATTDLRVVRYLDGADGEAFGGALASAGDLDGEGRPDLLVGGAGRRLAKAVTAAAGAPFASFAPFFPSPNLDLPGTPLAAVDLDGDGVDEVVVGAPLESPGGLFMAGKVSVFTAGSALLGEIDGDVEGLQYGHAVAPVGDLNGDGYAEFAVGALGCAHRDCLWGDGPQEGPSRVDVIDGATLTVLRSHAGPSGLLFGASLAGGFDLDADGVPDYVIGAPAAAGHESLGKVYVVDGATGVETSIANVFGRVRFGAALTTAVVDGAPMIFIGSPGATDTDAGYVQALAKVPVGLATFWALRGEALNATARFGSALRVGGRVDGDDVTDLLVGAPGSIQDFAYGPGSAFVVDARSGAARFELRGHGCDGGLGFALTAVPDLNAAPRAEWFAAAPGSSCNGILSGRIYLLTTDP